MVNFIQRLLFAFRYGAQFRFIDLYEELVQTKKGVFITNEEIIENEQRKKSFNYLNSMKWVDNSINCENLIYFTVLRQSGPVNEHANKDHFKDLSVREGLNIYLDNV